MKKLVSLLLAAVCCVTALLPAPARAADEQVQNVAPPAFAAGFASYEAYDVELTDADKYVFIDPELAAKNETRVSTRETGGTYLYSYYTYVSSYVQKYDSKSTVNPIFLLSVAKGQTVTLSRTVSTTGTIGFTSSIEANLKNAVAAKVGANTSYVRTLTVEQSAVFTFPPGEPGNTASYYVASGFDLYQFTYKKYDVYVGDGVGGGMGVGQETVYAGQVTPAAHIPKRVIYSVTATVG